MCSVKKNNILAKSYQLISTTSSIFSLWDISRGELHISAQFRRQIIIFLSFFCQFSVFAYLATIIFENQVASTKWHLPKVVVAWTVVRIPYLTTCWAQRCNKATFLSILKKIPSKVISKMGEYRIEIGKVRCGLGFYCYTRSLTHSERQSQ